MEFVRRPRPHPYLIAWVAAAGCSPSQTQTKASSHDAVTSTAQLDQDEAGDSTTNASLETQAATGSETGSSETEDSSTEAADTDNSSLETTAATTDESTESEDSSTELTSEETSDITDEESSSSDGDTDCMDEITILPSLEASCGSLLAKDFLALALGTHVVELQWLATGQDILVSSHRDAFTELSITTTYDGGEIRCIEYCPTGDEGPDPLPGLAIDVQLELQSADGALAERWSTEIGGRIRQANFNDTRTPPHFDGALEVELVHPDYENERASISGHFTEDRIWGDIIAGARHKHPDGPGFASFLGRWRSD